jgi:hypothetical protein
MRETARQLWDDGVLKLHVKIIEYLKNCGIDVN